MRSASADLATVLVRAETGEFELVVVSGTTTAPDLTHPRSPLRESLAGAVIESGETVVVEDARVDPRIAYTVPEDWHDLGPLVVVPLRTLDGVEGVLTLGWTPEQISAFRSVDVRMPERFAGQAALALQISRAREDREKLAVFEDRDRIGRDLHDLVIQRLFAIGLGLENTARMAQQSDVRTRVASAVDDIDETIKDIRRSIFALSVAAGSTDLRATVTELVERATKVLGFRPSLRFEGPVDSAVTPDARRSRDGGAGRDPEQHGSPRRGDARLGGRGGGGAAGAHRRGRRTRPAARTSPRSGLRNLQERAESLGGTCSVETPAPGGGTVVTWSVPLRRAPRPTEPGPKSRRRGTKGSRGLARPRLA